MALSKALLKRLNSDDIPVAKRIKLAETAMDLSLIPKEDSLVKWLCKLCVTNQCLLKCLNNCLKSVHELKTSTKQYLVDMLVQILNSNMTDVYEEDLECCSLILANNSMRQYFANKPKNLDFLKILFNNVSDRSSCHNSKQEEYDQLLKPCVQLAIIVLRHHKIFEIPDRIIKNLWFIILKYPCKNLLEVLLASSESKEFYEFLRLLYAKTIESLSQTNEATWTNLFLTWSGIMKTNMRVKRNKARLDAINNLFETVLMLNIPDTYWSGILDLSHDIISVKHLVIPDTTIDLIILIGIKSLVKVKISSCDSVLAICETLMKVRTNLITDRLPNLLLLYRAVTNIIVHASKNVADKFEEHRFRCFAFGIEKLTGLLMKLKKDMIRLSPYVIADFLHLCIESAIPSYIKCLQSVMMKIRIPLGLTRDQFYVVLILGTVSGLYNWKSLLENHLKEEYAKTVAEKEESNEVKQTIS
ncbi:hypothetical protein EAG_05917 [Camponotus floridanus]|uniref:Uncharacterized protein n=1 Tax=Camponotus floridanus TaxID=104421 RepID=E2AY78_CAMFO|nr:hypothetical protein EAG_05917 [Camponotus floridanus]